MKFTISLAVVVFSTLVCGLQLSATAAAISFTTPRGTTTSGGLPVSTQATFTTSGQRHQSHADRSADRHQRHLAEHQRCLLLAGRPPHQQPPLVQRRPGTHHPLEPYVHRWTLRSHRLGSHSRRHEHPTHAASFGLDPHDYRTRYRFHLPGHHSTIAGSASDNPFLAGTVTFDIPVPGVTSSTHVSWATFHFGVCADDVQVCQSNPVPEPATWSLAAMALVGGALMYRRGRASSK